MQHTAVRYMYLFAVGGGCSILWGRATILWRASPLLAVTVRPYGWEVGGGAASTTKGSHWAACTHTTKAMCQAATLALLLLSQPFHDHLALK